MPQFTNWTSVRSDGTIADSIVPASAFQFRYYTYLWSYASNEGAEQAAALVGALGGIPVLITGISGKAVKPEFTLQIIRGGVPVFEVKVIFEVDIVALSESSAFGTALAFFSWRTVDSASHADVTLPVPPPATIGTAQLTPIPGGGGDYSTGALEIQIELRSPAWQFPLLPGDKLRIPFHSFGEPELRRSNTNVQFRTLLGGGGAFCRNDVNGETFLFYLKGEGIACTYQRRADILTYSNDDVLVAPGVSPIALHAFCSGPGVYLVYQAEAVKVTVSYDRAATWEVTPVAFTGFNLLACAVTSDGSAAVLLGRATADGPGIITGDIIRVLLTRTTGAAPFKESLREPVYFVNVNPTEIPGTSNPWHLSIGGPTATLVTEGTSSARVFTSGDLGYSFTEAL